MPPLSQEFTMTRVDPAKLYTKFDGSNMINFGRQTRRTDRSWNGVHGHDPSWGVGRGVGGGLGVEFRAHNHEESGVTSPPLWQTSPPSEKTPLQSRPYNSHHYNSLSPASRTEAVIRGRDELMEMVKNMPEATYELSLKDIVEHSRIGGNGQAAQVREVDASEGYVSVQGSNKKKTKKKKNKKMKVDQGKMSRSGSMNNGPFLLKMFVPSLGLKKKKKNSETGTCAKVSPKPVEGEKSAERDWWKKRLTVVGEAENNGPGSRGSSTNSRSSRIKGEALPSCWSFLKDKKSKTKEQKGSLF